jgi:hypothetical protein
MYGAKAIEKSSARSDELAEQDDYNGQAIWRRITDGGVSDAETLGSWSYGVTSRLLV